MPYNHRGKRHPRSKVTNREELRKNIEEDVERFLDDGKTIESEISPPKDLRFDPPEINTYEHKEFLKSKGFIWSEFKYSWFAPSESSWLDAYETCIKNQKPKSEGNWTNANTSEARTSRFLKRFK